MLNKEDIESRSENIISGRLGETKKIAIYLVILEDLHLSGKLTPYDVVFILNRYFNRMVKSVEENKGIVDNYIGDGMVAIFALMMNQTRSQRLNLLDMSTEMDDMKLILRQCMVWTLILVSVSTGVKP